MARQATRPMRGFVALMFVAACTFVVPNFSMIRGPVHQPPRSSRRPTLALAAVEYPTFGSTLQIVESMQSIYRRIGDLESLLEDRTSLTSPTQEQVDEYDQKLSADIQMLEDLIQDSLEVGTKAEVEWLENSLEALGQLKGKLVRHRFVESSANLLGAEGTMPMLLFLPMLFLAGVASFENLERMRSISYWGWLAGW